jgi:hypothetical protein
MGNFEKNRGETKNNLISSTCFGENLEYFFKNSKSDGEQEISFPMDFARKTKFEKKKTKKKNKKNLKFDFYSLNCKTKITQSLRSFDWIGFLNFEAY